MLDVLSLRHSLIVRSKFAEVADVQYCECLCIYFICYRLRLVFQRMAELPVSQLFGICFGLFVVTMFNDNAVKLKSSDAIAEQAAAEEPSTTAKFAGSTSLEPTLTFQFWFVYRLVV